MANLTGSKYLRLIIISLALLPGHLHAADSDIFGPSSALTTRYWDCCKPSCSWTPHGDYKGNPVTSCDEKNKPLTDYSLPSSCQLDQSGQKSYLCANNAPWAVNDTFSYGMVGAYVKGGNETTWCGACYHLTFTSGAVKGKTMIVQATNTDYEYADQNVFTFSIPGGNTSYAGACATQYGVPESTFGATDVGLSTRAGCDGLPVALRPGCYWRFDWFKDTLAPTVDYRRVQCPSILTDITGAIKADDDTFGKPANVTDKDADSKSDAPALFSHPSITLSAIGMMSVWLTAKVFA